MRRTWTGSTAGGAAWTSPRRGRSLLTPIALALALALSGVMLQALARPAGRGWALPPGQPTAAARPSPGPQGTKGTAVPAIPTPTIPAITVEARVGLQVGHWRIEELPDELARLRENWGGSAGGVREVEVNLAVAEETAAILRRHGVTVDILPATVPPGYRADAFVAIHCDINNDSGMRGYKLARYRYSAIPALDDALIAAVGSSYAATTGQPQDSHITRGMTEYYAFSGDYLRHAVDAGTPAAIVELGFLTNPGDRVLLTTQPQLVAWGLAAGILRFLAAPDGGG
ncbi:MAG: N-acetylmuramoyl-L-alanine amidase [Chloroflexota bacterium]|nr:N-acetylmuramoyl-L-alanine amidase [Chloroflexota bacterium]